MCLLPTLSIHIPKHASVVCQFSFIPNSLGLLLLDSHVYPPLSVYSVLIHFSRDYLLIIFLSYLSLLYGLLESYILYLFLLYCELNANASFRNTEYVVEGSIERWGRTKGLDIFHSSYTEIKLDISEIGCFILGVNGSVTGTNYFCGSCDLTLLNYKTG